MAVADALQRVLADARPLPAETVALDEALGRVLTDDVIALRTQPPAALSAMDGYAVRGGDVAQAPVTLKVIGEVAAGHPFAGKVGPGEAARIFTGGVMPAGSDTVVIQEFTTQNADRVTIQKATAAGRNVRAAGMRYKLVCRAERRGAGVECMVRPELLLASDPLANLEGTSSSPVPSTATFGRRCTLRCGWFMAAASMRSRSVRRWP